MKRISDKIIYSQNIDPIAMIGITKIHFCAISSLAKKVINGLPKIILPKQNGIEISIKILIDFSTILFARF